MEASPHILALEKWLCAHNFFGVKEIGRGRKNGLHPPLFFE